jgi:transposase InsO family protein
MRLNMALHRRKPTDVIHHSDQGCQYTSIAFGKRCAEAGVRPSMGSVGDCFNNAMCESFNASWNASYSSNIVSRISAKLRSRFSTSSKDTTICIGDIPLSETSPRQSSNAEWVKPPDV